jgi:hypothetical protein
MSLAKCTVVFPINIRMITDNNHIALHHYRSIVTQLKIKIKDIASSTSTITLCAEEKKFRDVLK